MKRLNLKEKKKTTKEEKQKKEGGKHFELSNLDPFVVFDKKIKKYIEYYGDDLKTLKKSYKSFIRYFIPVIALVTLFAFLKIKILLFSIPPLVLIAYTYPLLYVWSKASEHRKAVNSEAPFISLIAYVNSLVDKGFNHTFKELAQIKELKTPRIEQNFIDKMINYMNLSFSKAIEKRALVHTGDLLGKLYNNYLTSLELGFTVKDRLRETTKELLTELKDSYKSYLDKSAEMTEMMFSLFLMVPIVLIGFSFTFKVSLTELMAPLAAAPAVYFLAASAQPTADYNIKIGKYAYVLLGIPVALIIPGISLTYKTIIAVSIVTVFSYLLYSQITLANELEKVLPTFLKELSEYMRIGYTIRNAAPRIKLDSKRAMKAIQEYLKDPENVNSPSKLFNLTFKLLFIIAKSGSSPSSLEELASTISDVVYIKNSIVRQLKMFDALAVLTPVMLWMTFTMLGHIQTNPIPQEVIIGGYGMVSGLLFAKISRFTLFYFPTVLLVNIILAILPFLPAKLLVGI